MQIFIPTRDRVNAQFTWDNLSPRLRSGTMLVCPPEEVSEHLERSRTAIARPALPLAGVRQFVLSELAKQDEPVIMCDDDLAFFVRKDPSAHNLRPAGSDITTIFQRLYCLVAGGTPEGHDSPEIPKPVVHAGLSPRQGNNWTFPDTVQYISRMNAVHCVLPEAFRYYGVRYDDVDLMEDYHATLSLFEKGEKNVAITDAAWDQCKGSGAPGGLSHYRTKETQAVASHKLAELHPLTVKVVEKTPSTGSGGFAGTRTDVRVQWAQAYKKGTKNPTFSR